MRRRAFLTQFGASAVFPWPALAQLSGNYSGLRRLGVLTGYGANDVAAKKFMSSLEDALAAVGWRIGANLSIEWRFANADPALIARYADELVALAPDALLALAADLVQALRLRTSTIPIVFSYVTDPVAQGFAKSLSHPGGNISGFTSTNLTMSRKWVDILAQLAPNVLTVGIVYTPTAHALINRMVELASEAALSHGAKALPIAIADEAGIEAAVAAISQEPRPGMIVLNSWFSYVHRAAIVHAAASARVPTVYSGRDYVSAGGLICYGIDGLELGRRSAGYVDLVLRGANPGDLPIQDPSKFEVVLNLKTAKALGLEIPPALLAAADEVIE